MKVSATRFYFAFTMQAAGMIGGLIGVARHASNLVWTGLVIVLIGNFALTHLLREAEREAKAQHDDEDRS